MTTSPRPRVLFVGRGAPWKGGAGYLVRQAMFLEAWTSIADVTAAMFDLCPDDVEAGVLDAGCERVVALPRPKRRRESRWAMLRNDFVRSTPRTLRGYDTEAVRVVIDTLKPDGYDAVFVYRIDSAAWAGLLGRPGLLLDIDDPEHTRTARRIETLGETPDGRSRRDLEKLKRFEMAASAGAKVSFVCQPIDRARFDEPKPQVVPNAVPTPEPCPAYAPDPHSLLFVGNLAGGFKNPNVDGLLWFVEHVFPLVRAELPEARLRVGGNMDDALEAQLDATDGVDRLGFVDDMPETVRRAAVNLAPIRFGTGTRIKVLDALAQGGAVVGTTLGCEGIDLVDGEHVRLADTPPGFVRACVELLGDRAWAARLGRNGHALIRQRYSTAAVVPRLAKQLAGWAGIEFRVNPQVPGAGTDTPAEMADVG
ncbi:MAG: glycosyltransferase [Planctomycetota bacterium]